MAKSANLPCFALKPQFDVQKIAWKKRIDNGYLQAGRNVEGVLHLAYCRNGSALDLIKKRWVRGRYVPPTMLAWPLLNLHSSIFRSTS